MTIREALRRTVRGGEHEPQLELLPEAKTVGTAEPADLLYLPQPHIERLPIGDTPDRARLEVKAVTTRPMLESLRAWLLVQPDGFRQRHPPRRVNSIYYDTVDLRRFTENLSGASERRKLRLRWYGHDPSAAKCTFEAKCKRNKLGWKEKQRVRGRLDLASTPWGELNASIRGALRESLRLRFDQAGEPSLGNRYEREYYESADGMVRLTIDHDIRAFDQRGTGKPNLSRPCLSDDVVVVEVKADAANGDRVMRTLGALPLRVSRHSKYAVGVAAMLGA